MMTQSVMTQAANLFGNAAVSVTTKGKQTGTGFELMINNSLKQVQSNTGTTETAVKKTSMPKTDKAEVNSDSKSNVPDQAEAAQNRTVSDTGGQVKAGRVQKAESKGTEQSKAADNSEAETSVPEEQLVEQISAFLQNVQQTIMDALNLTSEQFEQLLADQGMGLTDLLQPGNLQQFILASQGKSDITAVLTDENLAATMKDLLQSVEDLQTNAELGLTADQMKEILMKAEQMKAAVQNQAASLSTVSDEKVTEEGKKENQPEAVNSSKTAANETENDNSNTNSGKLNTVQSVKTESAAESGTGAGSGSGQEEQNNQEVTDPFQTFVDNLVKTSQVTKPDFNGNMVQVTELRDIANQIIDRIRISVTTDQKSMELQLNPENLGKVNLTVQSKNGVMTAQFVVQNEICKEAIESQMNTLKETLSSQGIKVEAIEVTVSSYAFDQGNNESQNTNSEAQKEKSGKKITLEEAMNMTETPADETITEIANASLGSQIDYTA